MGAIHANAPFDICLVQERLRQQCPDLEQVLGDSEYASVRRLADFRAGTAYVVLAGERNHNTLDSNAGNRRRALAQVDVTFGVIVATRNYRSDNGKEARQAVRPLISSVREALVGWSPADCAPVAWQEASTLDSDQSKLLWLDVFNTQRFIRGSHD